MSFQRLVFILTFLKRIIVGVKYCFRYNARARQMRLAAEDGEPINMENMPHPRRRRREKKLMTIDEVNEKFPMMKYKTWVASRALDGLPTRGGVDAPSRANSVRSAAGVIAPANESQQPAKTTTTATTATVDADAASTPTQAKAIEATTTPAPAAQPASGAVATAANHDTATQQEGPADARASIVSADGDAQKDRNSDEQDRQTDDDDDDDEHIDSALPPECVGTSGDTCAICIDTLEDDDDVRGLTCGHTFHAVCLDPWLTSRRACCPLCKADYYTPKPRASPAEGDANQHGMVAGIMPVVLEPGMSRHRTNITRPSVTWAGLRGPGSFLPARFTTGASEPQAGPNPPATSRSNWISNLRPFRRRQGQASPEASQPSPAMTPAGASANSEVTPSQLEAGVRS